ncbi:ACT domain-containing protein [Actinomadura gamaensis]|uniref:ACT domain-containing protein n=1 Tax=Actinomadura gamaensis TaxID=1763541 RepID=A0ABV9U0Q6_9ACTN
MLLRIRVRLPDRPGSLASVARTLGAAGADVVQMAVLERDGGRALDDFTVAWPAGAGTAGLRDGLTAIPGVAVAGIWPTVEPKGAHPDAALLGQLAADPARGTMTLADAVPALLSADWAALAADHVLIYGSLSAPANAPGYVYESALGEGWGGPSRARAFSGDGFHFAACPVSDGLDLLVARGGDAPPFHRTEVFRLDQLVVAARAVLAAPVGR